jgi:hypothetical protein
LKPGEILGGKRGSFQVKDDGWMDGWMMMMMMDEWMDG